VSRAYSTFELLERDEFATGVARAAAELPPVVDSAFDWLLVAAVA
jgi:hypothetical protein